MDKNIYDDLCSTYENFISQVYDLFVESKDVYSSIFGYKLTYVQAAVHCFLCSKNSAKFKRYNHHAADISNFAITNFPERFMSYAGMTLNGYIPYFFSDNKPLIDDILDRQIEIVTHKKALVLPVHNTLRYIKENNISEAKRQIEIIAKLTSKYNKSYKALPLFLSSLINKNEDGISEALFLSSKQKRFRYDFEEFDYFTLFLCKVATYFGMEISIDIPFVPRELIPFEPLDKYETLDYLVSIDVFNDYVQKGQLEFQRRKAIEDAKNKSFFKKIFRK